MSLPLRAWLLAARARRRVTRERRGIPDPRALIRRYAPGRSFADLGCMWGVDGAYSFLAEEAGATRVTAVDAMEETEAFRAEHARRGSAVTFRRGDLHDAGFMEQLGEHDVVWCAGVLYHTPHPMLLLERIRPLVRSHLILGCQTLPEVPGLPQACMFFPGVDRAGGRAFAPVWPGALGLALPFDRRPEMSYANYWWGLSPSALRAMLQVASLEVVEERSEPFSSIVVARAV